MTVLSTLFPREVTCCDAAPWMWETPALPGEEVNIAKAVEKRKREFRAGRHCAHSALSSLLGDSHKAQRAIKINKSRGPCWPQGIVGSISHSGDHCSAAVALSSDILSIGHDVEKARPLDKNVYNMICTQKEQAFLERHNTSNLPLSTLIFSAKESIHKTYFPLNQHMLDFLDAEIDVDIENGCFIAHIVKPEDNPKYAIRRLEGKFSLTDNYIYTGICLRPHDIPQL